MMVPKHHFRTYEPYILGVYGQNNRCQSKYGKEMLKYTKFTIKLWSRDDIKWKTYEPTGLIRTKRNLKYEVVAHKFVCQNCVWETLT